jgi:A/G-specific adenine glycosylase
LSAPCKARALGVQSELPAKENKKPKPTRYGIAYLGRRADGAWLLERRPESGLLGGMLGWPGSAWGDAPVETPPVQAVWRDPGAEVRHTFTHFHLKLALRIAHLDAHSEPRIGIFVPASDFRPGDLPTVMRKAFDLVARSLVDS